MKDGYLKHGDCMDFFKELDDNSIDLVLTDIPYDIVNRSSNGLRNLDKGKADVLTFNIKDFVSECYRVAKTTIIFCGAEPPAQIRPPPGNLRYFRISRRPCRRRQCTTGCFYPAAQSDRRPDSVFGHFPDLSGPNTAW